MIIKSKEFILYGLENIKGIIAKIIADLNILDKCFDVKLMLTEALTNAFMHGNKCNVDKPIYLRYVYDGTYVSFEIEDSGTGLENIIIPEQISNESLLNDSGRGLFIIKSMADKIELRKNTLIIGKCLN
ncbi:ATP-binding protein [Clostridium sp. CS001]|uniref:ATP-binding protein n=1 Tax=Clostridium sp. CS001 TaxID=2880648 RepID=UPI001CF4E713|nr:ATP-binding protein [Clostridium sp. CS001]MCB2289381.1 ATP-binding protein [Clostridium sp. CS001]